MLVCNLYAYVIVMFFWILYSCGVWRGSFRNWKRAILSFWKLWTKGIGKNMLYNCISETKLFIANIRGFLLQCKCKQWPRDQQVHWSAKNREYLHVCTVYIICVKASRTTQHVIILISLYAIICACCKTH